MSTSTNNQIDASPTKDFFITMLVKDIELIRAIIDLVDNSLDGARRMRKEQSYEGLWVRLEVTPDHFIISDNCGGIPIEIARHYAFRFGRPAGAEQTPYSVGQFGVGMKRSLFKLGRHFVVESKAATSHFVVDVDVDEWRTKEKDWTFAFKSVDEKLPETSMDERGTKISVISLHENVSTDFRLENVLNRLREELSQAHLESIDRGLIISLNGIPINVRPLLLLQSEVLRPGYKELVIGDGDSKIMAKIYAGISNSEPAEAGWYIFCNGRLVLGADQSPMTGWGEGRERTIPKYHNQYARFRGYVFFDSDDASLLPWNTTKTGVDTDSAQFRAVKQEMLSLMRPVIDFLNVLKNEHDKQPEGNRPLEAIVSTAPAVRTADISAQSIFVPPRSKQESRGPDAVKIVYQRPMHEVNRAKELLGVTKANEVGIKTFEYFMSMEGGE